MRKNRPRKFTPAVMGRRIPPKSPAAIKAIFSRIADKYPENILSEVLDLTAPGVRIWVNRGIPPAHWEAVARLAKIPVSVVEAAHKMGRRSRA